MYAVLLHGEGLIQAIVLIVVVFLILQVGVVIVGALCFQRYLSNREEEKQARAKGNADSVV